MVELRPYQITLVDEARSLMREGINSIVIQSATGSGKTCLTAHMLKTAASREMDSFFILHRRELIRQSIKTFHKFELPHGVISPDYVEDLRHRVQIASIQSLNRRLARVRKPKLVIWDECFVAGTLIDGRPIENVRAGDFVLAWDEAGQSLREARVLSVSKRRAPSELFRISAGGKSVICTGTHPFLTSTGDWRCAQALKEGDEIYAVVRSVRKTEKPEYRQGSLLGLLQSGSQRKKSQRSTDSHEDEKSDVDSTSTEANDRISEKNQTQTSQSRRERKAITKATAFVVEGIGRWLEAGVCSAHTRSASVARTFNSLQNRYCSPGEIDRDRGGRQHSLWSWFNPRQKETRVSEKIRVDCVEVFERGSDVEFERLCPDGCVYNFEVDKLHTYTANDFIVHNCHHTAAKSWANVYDAFPGAFHIGLTATPRRTDNRGLGRWFKKMIHGPSVAWLIENGFLSRYRIFAPGNGMADKPTITGDAIREYKARAAGKRALVFAASIQDSNYVVEQFKLAGFRAAHVDGESESSYRDDMFQALEDGKLDVLSQVQIAGEGVDIPAIEVVIDLSPTTSLAAWLQRCGRALRPWPGKTEALILDHAGNCERHGLPDEPREWVLEGDGLAKRDNDTGPSLRICKKCFAAQFPGSGTCQYCGNAFEIKARKIARTEGRLKEMTPEMILAAREKARERQAKAFEQSSARTYEQLVELGRQRKYVSPESWAHHIMRSRRGRS